ncbi:hypothetical protein K2173_019190 [Erythroxylum novogranatense]|uniref:Uncharacterized protein n=1 Tax=Erythroxylum novogranatense TaxID=1862640 RepID=A0AAV8SSW4_9ROSI|nr:hypothetical protein K2173_019190 [Erythroxylum novogranatense]
MDGLIPMVYRAIKKNKVRRKYEFLSSESAQSYNISDFLVSSDHMVSANHQLDINPSPAAQNHAVPLDRKFHRRHMSVDDFTYGDYKRSRTVMGAAPSPQKQLVRFRSHRMFSCITGV